MNARLMVGIAVVLLALSGCTSAPPQEPPDQSPAPDVVLPGKPGEQAKTVPADQATAQRTPVNVAAADVTYMTMMIPHHQQAIVMTDLVASRAKSERLRKIAARIDATQDGEITTMRTWLKRHGGKHTGHEAHGRMPGMATQEQLDELKTATGVAFDRLFLQLMITHHEGAVTMAKGQLAKGVEPTALEMANHVLSSQRHEIQHMRTLLNQL